MASGFKDVIKCLLEQKKWKFEQKPAVYLSVLFLVETLRSSCPEVFCKKDVFKKFAKFTGKHLCQSFFFNEVAGFSIQHQFCRC